MHTSQVKIPLWRHDNPEKNWLKAISNPFSKKTNVNIRNYCCNESNTATRRHIDEMRATLLPTSTLTEWEQHCYPPNSTLTEWEQHCYPPLHWRNESNTATHPTPHWRNESNTATHLHIDRMRATLIPTSTLTEWEQHCYPPLHWRNESNTATHLHIDEMVVWIDVLLDKTTDTQESWQQLPLLLQMTNKCSKWLNHEYN